MFTPERGVVWEETLILIPDNIHYVFLSATIPNARQFAQWIVHLHKQPCHVVYTDYRPTPLQHYIFPAGADGLYLVVNEKVISFVLFVPLGCSFVGYLQCTFTDLLALSLLLLFLSGNTPCLACSALEPVKDNRSVLQGIVSTHAFVVVSHRTLVITAMNV